MTPAKNGLYDWRTHAAKLTELRARFSGDGFYVKPITDRDGDPYATLYQTWLFIECDNGPKCGFWKDGKPFADFIAYAANHVAPTLAAMQAEIDDLRAALKSLNSPEYERWERGDWTKAETAMIKQRIRELEGGK